MSESHHDARRLDVVRLAAEGSRLSGGLAPAALPRLCADAPLVDDGAATWQLAGELRYPSSASPQPWLTVTAEAPVVLTCQRCLQPMVLTLSVDRPIRFVRDEDEAERLDEEGDDDVLALPPRGLDALALIEDELILALPLVPRHAVCPQPLPLDTGEPAARSAGAEVRENPFSVLASLKRPSSGGRQG